MNRPENLVLGRIIDPISRSWFTLLTYFNLRLMKKFLLILVGFLIFQDLPAQFQRGGNSAPKIKGKVSGKIMDSLSMEVVGFATISMRRAGRDKVINGALTDENGEFSFTDINPGKYDLEISFLGYEPKIVRDIETTKKSPDNNIGSVYLVSTDYVLEEVQVTSTRSLIENKVDRIVFNAEDDASIAGGDATDVLRKVPNLSVDLDGNVSIRGSQNIQILINGKPSGMFSSNVAEALKMFPADQIKRVEVITSPGAKYDAEGSGGIINLVTKKSNVEGIAGSFNLSGGTRQNSAFTNLNVGKGRFGSTFNGSVFYSIPADGTFIFERQDNLPDGTRTLTQNGISNTSRLGFRGTASAFYDFNAYNALNTSFSTRGFGFDSDGVFQGQLTAPGDLGFSFQRDQISDNITEGFDWNTDYTRKFEGNDVQELVIAYQLSRNNQDQENDVIYNGSLFSSTERLFNDSDNWESTMQVDYTQPLPNSVKLEVGAKAVLRDIDSDSRYNVLNPDGQFELDFRRSNIFKYDQNVMAGYAQLNFVIAKLQFITGLRYERTEIAGTFEESTLDFGNEYENWMPNFTVSKSFKNFRSLKFSYSKRIQRPSLFFINPFINTTDFTNVSFGNPILDPEITHQYEISYNTRILGFGIFPSIYYKRTNDIIERTLGIIDETNATDDLPVGVSFNTFSNVGTNNSFGLNFFTNKSINKLNIRFGGDIFTYDATGIINGEFLSNSAMNYQLFAGGDYSITGTLKADFFGFFRSDRPTLQGSQPSFSIYGIGIRKDINNWSVGIRIIEPFVANKEFNTDLSGPNFQQVSGFSIPFRSFGLNLRYKFGKVDFKERRSKIRNTDSKSGGDGQGGGQQGGQQGGGQRGN